MPTFGDRLRHERESRGRSIEEMAAATGVQQGFLEALERDEFDALPGRAFGKLYLRAYAEILEFDPQPLIEVYDREAPQTAPPTAPEKKGSRPVAEAIARWRSSKVASSLPGSTVAASLLKDESAAEEKSPDDEVSEPPVPEKASTDIAGIEPLPPPEEPPPDFVAPRAEVSTSSRPPWVWGVGAGAILLIL